MDNHLRNTKRGVIINNLFDQFANSFSQLTLHLPITVGFVVLLFMIHILNSCVGHRLNVLGIWPRKKYGWIGIPFSPFLHGNLAHLMFNMIPLFVFSNVVLMQGVKTFYLATAVIILLSGILVYLFGRRGIHVGASSLIMGYLGFIIVNIYYHPTALSLLVGFVCLFYFGGIFMNLLPSSNKQISWEGHVFGFISGIATAYFITLSPVLNVAMH